LLPPTVAAALGIHLSDANAQSIQRKHPSGTNVESWDATPFLDEKTGAFKPLPLNVIEPDNEVKAEEYKPFYCLKWHDGCTECQRTSVSGPVTCGPLEVRGQRICEPQKVACHRADWTLQHTYCRTISMGTEALAQELYQRGKRFELGNEIDPYERHFNFAAYEHVGLTARDADVLRKRYGSSYFDSRYCVQPRLHVDKFK
jgi:hypothetical protein